LKEDVIRESKTKFAFVATEVYAQKEGFVGWRKKVFTKENTAIGDLAKVINASSTFFPVSKPYKWTKDDQDLFYMDGGAADNIPVAPAIEMGATDVIVVNVGGDLLKRHGEERSKFLENSQGVRMFHVKPDQDIGGTFSLDPETGRKGMEIGYADGMKFFERYMQLCMDEKAAAEIDEPCFEPQLSC